MNTRKSIKQRLSILIRFMMKKELLTHNPLHNTTTEFKEEGINKKKFFPLPTEEVMRDFLASIKEHPLYPIVLLAVYTGMRKGELLGLKWTQVDFKHNKININNQVTSDNVDSQLKTASSYRVISVSPKVMKVLEGLTHRSDYVFTNPRTNKHYSIGVSNEIKKLWKGIFPDNFVFHDLRHYHATQLLAKGIPISVISHRLGHSNITTTLNTYVNYMPSLDDKASRVLD